MSLMDVNIQYVEPVKEDFVRSGVSLAADIRNALALISVSAPPLKDHKASLVEKIEEGEVYAQKEDSMVVKLASDSEYGDNEELKNSKSKMSLQEDVNEEKKILEVAVDEKFASSLNLVSAMKGSRKKQGLCAEKLSVSWAADVYDPPVTSQSHSISDDDQNVSKSSKQSYNKKKHKGKSSRKNNEKKKGSKTSRNSSKVASY